MRGLEPRADRGLSTERCGFDLEPNDLAACRPGVGAPVVPCCSTRAWVPTSWTRRSLPCERQLDLALRLDPAGPLALSVAAYTDHADDYVATHAPKMLGLRPASLHHCPR